jgi:tetratricopeptide (TPR) repeat protein
MRRSQIHQRIGERGVVTYGDRCGEIAAELAMHFEQSRDWPRALHHLIEASKNATHKSAHYEAAELSRRGLQILKALPKSSQAAQEEITLRIILTVSLMATKGFASTEVAEVYADGKELFGLSGQSPQLFNMLYLLGFSYIMVGKIRPAMEIAQQLLALAAKLEDPTIVMEAHRAMGATLMEMGRCTEALEHLDRASGIYSANRRRPYTLNIGHDCKALSECFAGRALWTLGFPDAALKRMQGALAFAKELSHPQSWVGVAHFASVLHQLRGEPLLAQRHAREVLAMADEHGLEYWVALGKIDLGWADTQLSNTQQGIEQMRQGLEAYEAAGGKLWSPHFLGVFADALSKAGRIEEGLMVIARALALADVNGEAYASAELHRIRGELIIKHATQASERNLGDVIAQNFNKISATVEAQGCFEKAIAIAKEQQARSWELRACLSLANLEPRVKTAQAQLAEAYSWFTEGYETADLKQARAQLSDSFHASVSN